MKVNGAGLRFVKCAGGLMRVKKSRRKTSRARAGRAVRGAAIVTLTKP